MTLVKNFSCFVTGTDTEIGKTLISSAILHALGARGVRAAGMKPIAAGTERVDGVLRNEDVEMIHAASPVKLARELTTPYLLNEPAAPHLAAMAEGVVMHPQRVLEAYQQVRAQVDAVVVEGVGGFRVPLTGGYDTADLARELGLPVVLVVGVRLGCINHALLTAEAITARGLRLAGWVANTVAPHMRQLEGNVATLRAQIAAPCLGQVPRLASPTAAQAAVHLDLDLLRI